MLAKGLPKERYDVRVASLLKSGPLAKLLKEAGIPSLSLDMSGIWDISVFIKLGKYLRSHKIEILHSFLFHSNLVGRLSAKAYGVPINISATRTMELGASWHLILDRLTKRFVDFELTNSDRIRDFLINKTGSKPDKLDRIHNGIALPAVDETARQRLRNELSLKAGEKVVGTVGSLEPAKNHELFLRAAKLICFQQVNVRFFIVGEGRCRARLEREIHTQGLAEKVFLLGFRQDIPAFLSLLDVFLFTSAWEGFPNAILEAMASGVPVVSSDAGGIEEIIENGVHGVVISSREAQPYAAAVLKLLNEPEHAKQLAVTGKERVSREFRVEKMIAEYDKVYQKLARKLILSP